MDFLLIVFIVSASVIVLLTGFRMIELSVGRNIIPQGFRDSSDRALRFIFGISNNIVSNGKKKIHFEMKKIPVMILHLLISLWSWALRVTLKTVNLVQGRKEGHVVKSSVSEQLKAAEALKKQLE